MEPGDKLQKLHRAIRSRISKSRVPEDPLHADNTLHWLLRLEPGAGPALKIAAFGHDIERAVDNRKVKRSDFDTYDAFKAAHARNSAEILEALMRRLGIPADLAGEIARLVRLHETGGDPSADLIKTADALSFFHVNLPFFFQREGIEATRKRIEWGYGRLSDHGRKIVRTFSYDIPVLNRLVASLY